MVLVLELEPYSVSSEQLTDMEFLSLQQLIAVHPNRQCFEHCPSTAFRL
jgi:hypothetical protein